MAEQTYISICRSVADGVTPGSITGFSCKACGRPVQLSLDGQRQMALVGRERMQFLCNPCGFRVMRGTIELVKSDPAKSAVLQINPEATKQLERITGQCALDIFPNAKFSFDPLDCFRSPK